MTVQFHSRFKKKLATFPVSIRRRFYDRLALLLADPYHPTLRNHSLQGRYYGYRSINITGDLRAIYKMIPDDVCLFVVIDTHSNLYK